ncbi:hypothetical protein DSO57_1027726 [Entomophthora muscae]|uniref:Uncharacterized protein n=1 Tax=Entomophthora muscae TaxID=34485 RepID=A0ACC2SR09_9FUNG|nr:hypothetical protein DSO57_1027726 [Entomophthora muscae]
MTKSTINATQPIDIKTKSISLSLDTSKEPKVGSFTSISSSPASSNLINTPSSSFSSQGEAFRAPLARRMSLNIGANVLSSPFFTAGVPPDTAQNPISSQSGLPRRSRTMSTSSADKTRIAEKWGFGLKKPGEAEGHNTFPRSFIPKPQSNNLGDFAAESRARPRSPMGDMILNGQFLD